MKPINKFEMQHVLKLINEMIEEHQGLEGAFHLGAVEALRNLKIEVINI